MKSLSVNQKYMVYRNGYSRKMEPLEAEKQKIETDMLGNFRFVALGRFVSASA